MEFPWNQISAIENRPYIELYTGPEQPGRREDGGGGKDREVLGATVRGQRGAGWEKEEGARRELES